MIYPSEAKPGRPSSIDRPGLIIPKISLFPQFNQKMLNYLIRKSTEKNIRNLVADQNRSKTEFFVILGNHAQDCIFANRI